MAKKLLIFRADGNSNTGLGHMYRIFALIEMLKDNFDYKLLVRKESVLSVIPEYYNLEIIPTNIDIQEEPIWLAKRFGKDNVTIIADGYQFDSEYQKNIKLEGFKLIYIDDLASEYMYADLVINHSPHVKKSDFKAEPYTRFALGTKYAILRPLFLDAAKKDREIDIVDTAFVCFGGADPNDITLKTAKVLLEFTQFKNINIVLGGAYKHTGVFELKRKYPYIIKLHKNLSELELFEVMKNCNFAIAPASTILYELCCVKMPILSGYFVDNQTSIFHGFLASHSIYGAGDFANCGKIEIFDFVQKILDDRDYNLITQYQNRLFDNRIKDRHIENISKL